MPFCSSCGSPVEGQFCSKCGTPIAAGAATGSNPPPPAEPYAQASAPPQTAVGTGGMTDNVAGMLCYILGFVTGILFLVLEPYNRNKFVRFHAFQAIFFNIAVIACFIGLSIIGVAMHFIPMMWVLIAMLHMVIWLGSIVVWIFLMVKAYQGQRWVLPVIGPLAEKQAQA